VRKVASGVGVERVFPLFSPIIDEILITKRSDVRRSKLYYIRDKAIRDVRRKMKNTLMVKESTKQFETKDAPVVEEQAEVEGTENTQA
jgi:large subunit ribosomal protein L19